LIVRVVRRDFEHGDGLDAGAGLGRVAVDRTSRYAETNGSGQAHTTESLHGPVIYFRRANTFKGAPTLFVAL
jgi:hypothetical protein